MATQPPHVVADLPAESSEAAVAERLRDHLAPHPRLLLSRDAQRQLAQNTKQDERLGKLYQRLLQHADAAAAAKPLQHKLNGMRMADTSTISDRVITSALAYRLSGDRKYFTSARDIMLNAASFADWNPSHFLDAAEVTMGLSIGYDWLYDDLSPQDRTAIRQAMIDKGLNPSFKDKPDWWVTTVNNWNQVCHGSLLMGALAIADEEPQLADRVIVRAVDCMPIAIKHYDPDGAYPEGLGYWSYGTTRNVLALAALQSALGDDFGLATPGLLKSAYYRLHLVGPSGSSFSYSDSHETAGTEPSGAQFYFAARNNDPSLLFHEAANLDRLLANPSAKGFSDASDWLLLLTVPPNLQRVVPASTHYAGVGDTPVATHRSSWDDSATFVAIKGGSSGENHAHMDVGSFCLDSDGVRWAGDLGAQDYNSLESKKVNLWNNHQGSQRWQVYRLGVTPHNILTVDGREQDVKGHAPIVRSTDHFTIIDATKVYADQLSAAARGVVLRADRSVRLQDEITLSNAKPATVRWTLLTMADVKPDGASATLTRSGKTLQMRVISPAGAAMKIISTDPPHDYDAKNPGSRLITFEVKLQPGESTTLAVDFTPGAKASVADPVTPLADWK